MRQFNIKQVILNRYLLDCYRRNLSHWKIMTFNGVFARYRQSTVRQNSNY